MIMCSSNVVLSSFLFKFIATLKSKSKKGKPFGFGELLCPFIEEDLPERSTTRFSPSGDEAK